MRRLLCTGDSHTWGQGAPGLEDEFDPPVIPGELRLAGFGTGGYVNLLRARIHRETGSYAREWRAADIASQPGIGWEAPCALVGAVPFRCAFSGELLRVEWQAASEPTRAVVEIDGEARTIELPGDPSGTSYRLWTLPLPAGEHEVAFRSAGNPVRLFRVECYGGPWAVINSGIGSCPAGTYRERYWNDYVAAVQPAITLVEAHTINDWLTGDPPALYAQRLTRLIRDIRALGSAVILLTVSPIAGPQIQPGLCAPYDAYVEASRRVAEQEGVPLCDAHAAMKACLDGMTEEEARAWLYADPWHVNERGHALYAQLLYNTLRNDLLQTAPKGEESLWIRWKP